MRIIHIGLCDITTRVLFIGMEGEQDHTQVIFDASPVLSEYPDATAALSVKPPVGDIYPVAVTKDGNNAIWNVSAADCANHGDGEYQLTFTNGTEIIKTFIGIFRVYISIIGNGTAPIPVQEWLQAAQEALGELNDISASAHDLEYGEDATAEIEKVGGHKNIRIGVPGGKPGDDGTSPVITVTDIQGGHRITITDINGARTVDIMDGVDGQDGEDGYSPVISVTDITGGHRLSITTAAGTQTVDVMDGQPGEDGYSPTVSVTDITGGHRVTITDKTGTHVFDVMDGETPTVPVTDVQVNGTSVLSGGVANVPVASESSLGAVKVNSNGTNGIEIDNGEIKIKSCTAAETKSGSNNRKAVTTAFQHTATFYGLAKAAGDTSQSSSSNAVGNYTEDAKSKISDMLNAPVSVSGSTPSITAKAGIRYVCGEVSTLTVVLPASGCVDVVFESGSTATVLTVTPPTGKTLKWANGFDPTSLDANTRYEILIDDGEWGMACSWT